MITTIIPCYNASQYLAQAIESVLAQTRRSDEIIVVDDCSTDESVSIAGRYPVRKLRTAKNSGHPTARNVGIAAAQGDVIAWLDADDYWEPNHLEVVAGLLDRFPEAAVAFSAFRFVGSRTGVWPTNSPCANEPRNVFWDCLYAVIVSSSNAVTRKSAMLQIGGYNEAVPVSPDFDLWLRLSRWFSFVSDLTVTANYRWHEKQIGAAPMRQRRSVYESRRRFWQQAKLDGDDAFTEELERRIQEIFERNVACAWLSRSIELVRFNCSLADLVPRESKRVNRFCRRLGLPERLLKNWATF